MGAMAKRFSPAIWADPEVVPYAARVSVWGRWFVVLVGAFEIAYRPGFWYPDNVGAVLLMFPLVTLNGSVHLRLLTNRPVTWRWMLLLSAMDVGLATASISIGPGFDSYIFVAYYPALALFVVVFTSLGLGLAWTTMTAAAYSLVCWTAGSGLDIDAGDEKVLVGRLAAMYALVLCVSLITRFERIRRQSAVARERQVQQERIEFSQEVHDTTAQTAYLISLGIHRARELVGKSDEELVAALDAASELSRSAMWELRRPIDAGRIFEGRELGRVLGSHCATFERITAVPAEMTQSGTEPPLDVEVRARLFSIAHNALTNAFVHARPGRVEVSLSFEADRIRLSVSDDGVGLPDDYAERGRGFDGMRADAERMGGTLIVESGEGGGGTTIACVVPLDADQRVKRVKEEAEMSSADRIRVMVVDDHPIMRNGLRDTLEASGRFEVVGLAGDGEEAVGTVEALKPEVIVMDVLMPNKDGIDACREVMELLPGTRVMMLTASDEEDAVIEAIAAGATGYLEKYSRPEELVEAVLDVAAGRLRIPDAAVRRVFAMIRGERGLTSRRNRDKLTALERETLTLFAGGRSYIEIAAERGNSTVTVRNTINRIQDKLGIRTKQELVIWAVRNGLVDEVEVGGDAPPAPEGQ